ncbi:hypothetical protein [Acetobacterium sp.]|uniref:hypothetical protein n=1 Tax=Acetobacterium sp. TaxID=1872094 RepID=UPI002F426BE5
MKSIKFNTEMVQALMKGRKTVTRRKIKPQANSIRWDMTAFPNGWCDEHGYQRKAPYQVGDELYVQETFCYDDFDNGGETIYYKANFGARHIKELFTDCNMKWQPSIHMEKEEARIFLKVTDVRVERLQDMNADDAEKEGIFYLGAPPSQYIAAFIVLWNSTVKTDELYLYGAHANPWVWVIEFERIK